MLLDQLTATIMLLAWTEMEVMTVNVMVVTLEMEPLAKVCWLTTLRLQMMRAFFADIDECSSGNNTCHVNATCSNTDGSYDCECLPGFMGDGFNCSSKLWNVFRSWSLYVYVIPFSDIDECADSALNNCSDNANCTDTIGSYECTCSLGYSGDGFLCDGMLSNPFL